MTDETTGSAEAALAGPARIIAGVTAAIAVVGFLIWPLGDWSWLTLGTGYVPMAPTTSLLVLMLAIAIGLDSGSPLTPPGRVQVARALAAGVCILALTIILYALAGSDPFFERWFFSDDLREQGVRIGRVSTYTAWLLLLLATGRVVLRSSPRVTRIGVAMTLAASLGSGLIAQAYLLGGPLMYGGDRIPVAALTATCLLALGVGSILTMGDGYWPVRLLLTTERREPPTPQSFGGLALLLSVYVALSGLLWYGGARNRAEVRSQNELSTVAATMADRVGAWYANQLVEANAVRDLAPWRSGGGQVRATDATWFAAVHASFGYESVHLYDAGGRLLLRVQDDTVRPVDLDARARQLIAIAPASVVVDSIRAGDAAHLTVWVPVLASPTSTRAAGWLALRTDVASALHAIVRDLPLAATSAEIVIAARDGDVAFPLHPLRKRPDAVQTLRLPLDDSSRVPSVRGLLGDEGVFTGIDYAGDPVTASVRRIRGTPWSIAAKVDRAELAVPVRRLALRATLVSLLLVLGVAALVYALWYRRHLAATSRELALLRERDASIDELRRSEDRFTRATAGLTDGVWDWDLRTGAFYITPRWRERLGVSEDTTREVQRGYFDRVHPDDETRARAALTRHFEHGDPYDLEVRVRDDAGLYRWMWVRGEVERDAAGVPFRMAGYVSDVTERREERESLRRLDRILRVRSAANQALVRTSTEQELLQAVCDVAVREGGYRMVWVGYAEPDEARLVRPVAWSGEEHGYLASNPISWKEEARGLGPTGRAIRARAPVVAQDILSDAGMDPWHEAARARGYASSATIPLDIDATTLGALVLYSPEPFAFDADELALLGELGNDLAFGIRAQRHRLAVERQKAELLLFREVMERSADAIFLIDAASGRFIDVNATACRELGYSREEMLLLGPADIVPRIPDATAWDSVAAELAANALPLRRSEHRRKDGSCFPVDVSRTSIEVGDRRYVLAIARDMSATVHAESARLTLEQQLLRAQRMESIGRLAGGVAHDFNNLLTVINGSADLAAAEIPAGSSAAADLQQIRAAGARAAGLTRQLLAFSRQSMMRREALDVSTLVSNFLTMLRRVIGEDIRVEAKLAPGSTLVFADPGQLEQVLMNLCVNARDAMPQGGTLTLATARVDIDARFAAAHETMSPGPHVLLAVSDTGEGMSAEVQSKMFEPFFTTKEPGKGTGLGLATVYGIVKQSGGSIWVESTVGRGTTFSIYLPVHVGELSEAPAHAPAGPPGGDETILVVEDETAIRQVVRRALERSGYRVLTAAAGAEALDILRTPGTVVHAVLTDLVMPGMSGIELMHEVRARFPAIAVLLTSGYSADALAGKLEQEPDLEIISKPYAVADLLRTVRRALDRALDRKLDRAR